MPKSLGKTIIFLSEYCELHKKPIQKMSVKGEVVCPRCQIEEEDKKLQQQIQQQYEIDLETERFRIFKNQSLVEDNTLLDSRFSNYDVKETEETNNKITVLDCVIRIKKGQVFNIVLQGLQGSGKSHLAYSVLYELNDSKTGSCAFLNINTMMRKIKDSFNNKESRYTEEYFIDIMSKVDFLALDDLGAETGAIDSDKRATDFVQRVLYAATTVRQDKVTILTTNLDGKTLYSMYDKKLISRLFKRPKFIVFEETKDKRLGDIPF
jgi:DNA replication protein DnaC